MAPAVALDKNRKNKKVQIFEAHLRKNVIGQFEAVDKIVEMYQLMVAGLYSKQKPLGNLLMLGPTGTGKTHICETVAQCLFGDPQALIKVDCAEFQHSHEVAKLIGSPPGYLGHRETHPIFTMDNLYKYTTGDAPIALVLFDEIEKASDSLWQLLLGILDKATLTLGDNRKTDFSRTLIFFTSNLGAKEMSKLLFDRQIGFQDASQEGMKDKLTNVATNAAKQKFSPEFMNRIDRTVVFNSLKPEHLKQILEIELKGLQKRISTAPNGSAVSFTFSDDLKQKMLDEGYEPQYGARHLKRALERNLINPIAAMMSTGQVMPGDTVHCRLEDGEIEFLSDRLPVYSAKDRQTWEEIC